MVSEDEIDEVEAEVEVANSTSGMRICFDK